MIYRKPEGPNSIELHRGFVYVEFEDPEDTKDAIDNMDQSELFGRVIKVSAAKPPKNVNEGLGSKTALWEQVCLFVFWSLHSYGSTYTNSLILGGLACRERRK
jgi:RNA recognition motif-containing protein